MKLYSTQRSPYARKAVIMAIEKGIEYEFIAEDLKNKSPELLTANPVAKIPMLKLDGGQCLCDSDLICRYFEDLVPEPAFYPQEDGQLYILNLDTLAKGLIDVTVSIFYETLNHPNDINQDFVARQEETITRSLAYFEDHVAQLAGFTIASISVVCALGYIQFRFPGLWNKDRFTKLAAWEAEMLKRPSVRETVPVHV